MTRLRDTIDRTPEYVNFIKELKQFHLEKGTTLQAEPVLGGRRLDLYKIFQVVASSGGFEEVTKNRGWKQVGDIFQFPSTCTNSAYILKGVYIRNLLGWEEEKLWKKDWKPPKELLGPNAHKSSTLAGKAYKSVIKKTSPTIKSTTKTTKSKSKTNPPPPSTPPTSLVDPLTVLQQLSNPLLYDFSNLNVDTTVYSPTASNTPSPAVEDQSVFTERDRILFALQFGEGKDVEWALDEIVTISFECPEKLDLNTSPFLLQLLVSLAQPCLTTHVADNALPTSATDTLNSMLNNNTSKSTLSPITMTYATDSETCGHLDISLKVLHILRNFSFLTSHVPLLAKNTMVKELLVQGLQASMSTGHVELGRHSMDVLENMAAHMELDSTQDPCLQCVQTLVAAHDRYLVIGSIRTLTWLTMNQVNHAYLETSPVMTRIAQMLLSNDEELVGTSLEYIYQYTRISAQARSRFLVSPPSNAYVGLLISLLMTKSKYFCTRFIQEDTALTTPNPTVSTTPVEPIVPRVPNLTEYQKLDEPFRCLGWLKDKFEVADRSSVLSLDDMYLLYEARFGLEKALKMRDFYTVMKIAFPKVSTTETKSLLGSPGQSAPVVEGLNIIGIQIKMSILQDRMYTCMSTNVTHLFPIGPQVPCKWAQCSLLFDDTFTLQRHILHDHMPSTMESEHYVCSWSHCKNEQNLFSSKDGWISHLRTHFYNQVGESCCNSPVQSPEPSLSPSPSTPASQISLTSTTSPRVKPVDMSDIQGIALVASHLLNWLSKDPQSAPYFIPYEKELTSIAEQRPKLAAFVWSICSNFKSSKPSQPIVSINTTPV
ncbi:uncharacterized protein B0P05DRAFT_524204 [Gilbertella persicaria]|uniref:uncharacterized protein n=1 Tax=Gilbertella persicaria TaxID=101096 RepID=UPI00221FBA1F|nr:uncharacterized protein B0P05DRAFT_524204 [Gilbertella persicaria]KAI8094989.1 hypothetical protein B0P05DRAFT_524204 [Gilbertella persicaria]